jgi:dGTPase
MLAIYACDPAKTKGRIYKEEPTPYRNEFERDRDRIIHSNAFKRLQYKTQVFVTHEGDHYRNRLTHSIEVSTVARSIAKYFKLSEDLAEGVALAHDLGHTPFGHAGEKALNEVMLEYGGFSHNAQSLKILTKIEQKYGAYDGLNLTWEVLEGIVKHNGPLIKDVPEYVIEYNNTNDLLLKTYAPAEAQLTSLADDIAYICHDLEDSTRAGIISFNDIAEIKIIRKYIEQIKARFGSISDSCLIYEVVRQLIHYLISDLINQTSVNLKKQKLDTPNDIRFLDYQLVNFTPQGINEIATIKTFLFDKVYKHHYMASMNFKCAKIVKELFALYMDNLELLPLNWRELVDNCEISKANVIADYIAGMTDRFAIKEHKSFYNINFNEI